MFDGLVIKNVIIVKNFLIWKLCGIKKLQNMRIFNIITHITTSCNYNCTYCDVIKDKKQFSKQNLEKLLVFIKNNKDNIERFKFF
jgi:MoaA/NifB/PqqE/SkfB family radical SAM enzyme